MAVDTSRMFDWYPAQVVLGVFRAETSLSLAPPTHYVPREPLCARVVDCDGYEETVEVEDGPLGKVLREFGPNGAHFTYDGLLSPEQNQRAATMRLNTAAEIAAWRCVIAGS